MTNPIAIAFHSVAAVTEEATIAFSHTAAAAANIAAADDRVDSPTRVNLIPDAARYTAAHMAFIPSAASPSNIADTSSLYNALITSTTDGLQNHPSIVVNEQGKVLKKYKEKLDEQIKALEEQRKVANTQAAELEVLTPLHNLALIAPTKQKRKFNDQSNRLLAKRQKVFDEQRREFQLQIEELRAQRQEFNAQRQEFAALKQQLAAAIRQCTLVLLHPLASALIIDPRVVIIFNLAGIQCPSVFALQAVVAAQARLFYGLTAIEQQNVLIIMNYLAAVSRISLQQAILRTIAQRLLYQTILNDLQSLDSTVGIVSPITANQRLAELTTFAAVPFTTVTIGTESIGTQQLYISSYNNTAIDIASVSSQPSSSFSSSSSSNCTEEKLESDQIGT